MRRISLRGRFLRQHPCRSGAQQADPARGKERSALPFIDPQILAPFEDLHEFQSAYSDVLTICPPAVTNHFSFGQVLPARLAAIQSAASTEGVGPRLAAGTLPTEWRESW